MAQVQAIARAILQADSEGYRSELYFREDGRLDDQIHGWWRLSATRIGRFGPVAKATREYPSLDALNYALDHGTEIFP